MTERTVAPREIPGLGPVLVDDVYAHAFETVDREVGGVFVGTLNPLGPPTIAGSVRATNANSSATQLTFTQDTWQHIHSAIARDYPSEQIVGWYHTHPGSGLFLSKQDQFIHRHFFEHKGQIAYVVDPIAGTEAVFRWDGDEVVEHYRRACRYRPPSMSSTPSPYVETRDIANGSSPRTYWGGFVEINPETSRPTLASALYLLTIALAIVTVAWALFLR